ncbi:KCNMA1 [Cordylochernes scorpioides]|uniref:KCNMA1 n=1 Tax=Cordylochernes scorpioides TaxID=51811 RepID=A0ABY6LD85_9ARAC|nr:KCNMA1 [Cordylochernes scorpioides]
MVNGSSTRRRREEAYKWRKKGDTSNLPHQDQSKLLYKRHLPSPYKPSQDLEADIFTKDLSRDQMKKHLENLSIEAFSEILAIKQPYQLGDLIIIEGCRDAGLAMESTTPSSGEETTTLSPDEQCLRIRKWWCFLLSSIFTFLAGLLIILIWRALGFLCCRQAKPAPSAAPPPPPPPPQPPRPGEPPEPGSGPEIGFMTQAKDWAGELISGQSTTGRILVLQQSKLEGD